MFQARDVTIPCNRSDPRCFLPEIKSWASHHHQTFWPFWLRPLPSSPAMFYTHYVEKCIWTAGLKFLATGHARLTYISYLFIAWCGHNPLISPALFNLPPYQARGADEEIGNILSLENTGGSSCVSRALRSSHTHRHLALRRLNWGGGGVFASQVLVTSTQVIRNLFSQHIHLFSLEQCSGVTEGCPTWPGGKGG